MLRRMQTRVLAAENSQDADAELARVDLLAQAAGHVAVVSNVAIDLRAGIAELDRLLDEYDPEYSGVPATSRYYRDPFVKARELHSNVRLLRDCIKAGQPLPLSPRLDARETPIEVAEQYLKQRRRLYAPLTDNVDAYARRELMAAGIGRPFRGDLEVVSMAVDHATGRTVMRSDIQVTETDPIIFLDQILGQDTLRVVRAGLEARADHTIDPIVP